MKIIDIDNFIASKPSLNTNQGSNNKDNSNKVTLDQGLVIARSKVKIKEGYHFDAGSLRNINGSMYYLYTLSNEDYTVGAYCVDVNTGQLFKCSDTMILTPIK